jgi:CHAT domain-containing protein/co-chaperonin GroES (HSP10)
VNASDRITAGEINSSSTSSQGGNISLSSTEGAVTSGDLVSSGATGGGTIEVKAGDRITLGQSDSSSTSNQGGNISLTSTGAVTSGDLVSSGATGGGTIDVKAGDRITVGQINSSSTLGNAGNVTLDPPNSIQVDSINAQGGTSGRGGIVDITTEQFFRATGSFTAGSCVDTSICSAGGAGGNSITIRHGGNDVTPFIVGDATTNGTQGAITSRTDNQILPTQSFLGPYNQDDINIVTRPLSQRPTPPITTSCQITPIRPKPTLTTSPDSDPASLFSDTLVEQGEKIFTREFEAYLGLQETTLKTVSDARNALRRIEEETGVKPAIIYAVFVPSNLASETEINNERSLQSVEQQTERLRVTQRQNSDQLELILVTAEGSPVRKRVSGTNRQEILRVAGQFRAEITKITSRSNSYLPPAQKMYQWLLTPLEADLKVRGIQNLVFIMDERLRSLPLAALHDGQSFLVENYSVGLMPSLSLTDTRYTDIKKSHVLAMGASKFTNQKSLPAVSVELSAITPNLWPGKALLDEALTLENLKSQRRTESFGIVHLATHAIFQPGEPSNSYIQLWDSELRLNQLRQLGWNDPAVQLLVLSACKTAQGSAEVELGFAGLSVQAGVKSALASLWFVSDEGTMALMRKFYEELRQAPIKAEALRRAQVAMLKGEVRLENGNLVTPSGVTPLPPELEQLGNQNLSHPKFWSAFTMIGNPW